MRALAIIYAIGVMLAAPATLSAADPAMEIETVPQTPPPQPAQTQVQAVPEPASPPPAPAPAPEPAAAQPDPKPVAVKAAPGSVQMRDFNFSPAAITVNVGESVTWVNAGDEPHNAVGDGFSTALLSPGKSASESFSSAGTFSYICTVHPQMKGTVKVVAAAQTQTQPQASGQDTTGTGGGQAPAAQDSAAPTGPQLANSGLDAWLLGLAGVAMLAAGTVLRRRLT